jgi:hypothetical protein
MLCGYCLGCSFCDGGRAPIEKEKKREILKVSLGEILQMKREIKWKSE